MRMSFDDHESFLEAEILRFNNPQSDPNTHQQVGTQERSKDIGLNKLIKLTKPIAPLGLRYQYMSENLYNRSKKKNKLIKKYFELLNSQHPLDLFL